jgi:hypothetical protein
VGKGVRPHAAAGSKQRIVPAGYRERAQRLARAIIQQHGAGNQQEV